MKFVLRKGSLFDNLFLTASRRWGRLDKAKTFTQKQAEKTAESLSTQNFGIFDLAHAKQMVQNEPQIKAARKI